MHTQSSHSADVVDLSLYQDISNRRVIRPGRRSASLLSLRQSLLFNASVEIDDLAGIRTHFSRTVSDQIDNDVRRLLNIEFGFLRVYRLRNVFIVKHRALEGLVGGLLRVQHGARPIFLPLNNLSGEPFDDQHARLTWGVGKSVEEADSERLRRRRVKRFQR